MSQVKKVPDTFASLSPYLAVTNAEAVIEFICRGLGGKLARRLNRADGSVGHTEIQIFDSRVMLAEATEQWPAKPASMHLYVKDVDAVFKHACLYGGNGFMPPTDMPHGDRMAGVADPSGNQWWIATHIEDLTDEEIAARQNMTIHRR